MKPPLGRYYIPKEAIMNGGIYSDERCPICGGRYKSEEPKGMACPAHPAQHPSTFVVRHKSITRRFRDYRAAYNFLTGLRYQEAAGGLDPRDYMSRAKPLAFSALASEWLEIKATQIKPQSLKPLRLAMGRAAKAWGETNIKNIQYAQVEDLLNSLSGLAPKSRKHTLDALKQLWAWAAERYEIPEMRKWPRLGYIEMAYRKTVDLDTQEAIINDIKEHEPRLVWLAIKWLATYIGVRPGEMVSLTDAQVDRARGTITIPHPKERRAKTIPLIPEDIAIIRGIPLTFDREAPFFRHESGPARGRALNPNSTLYRAWKRACKRLGVVGVSLYPGTKHSTAQGLRAILTPEEIRAQTLHRTSAAFNRYFQTGGEDLRNLLGAREAIINQDNHDKGLIRKKGGVSGSKVIDFLKN